MIQQAERAFGTLWLVLVATCTSATPRLETARTSAMTHDETPGSEAPNDRHEAWLREAIDNEGEAYVQARSRLLAEIDRATPVLESARLSSDARHALTAAAVLGHARDAATYATARGVLTGQGLPPARNVMGKYTVETLGKKIADLGEIIDPWLYETLLKSKDYGSERERAILETAIENRASPILLPVFVELAEDRAASDDWRHSAIVISARTGDTTTHARLAALVGDESELDEVRSVAAHSLAERWKPPAPSFRHALETVLLAENSSLELKKGIVEAFRPLGDLAVLPTLYKAIDANDDDELLQKLCGTLEMLGDASSIPHVESALHRITDEVRRSTCEEDLESLRQRTHSSP